jgi:HNH endonuclease
MTFSPTATLAKRQQAVQALTPSEKRWLSRRTPVTERVWLWITRRGPDDCWEWAAARSPRGYGKLAVDRKHWRAHRLVWTLTHGEIPSGMVVCHRCDNPPCCNPSHLFLGTDADNLKDARDKGRLIVSRPGETNGWAKLNADQVRELRRLRASGWTLARLAAKYQIAFQTVSNIARRDVWRHIA